MRMSSFISGSNEAKKENIDVNMWNGTNSEFLSITGPPLEISWNATSSCHPYILCNVSLPDNPAAFLAAILSRMACYPFQRFATPGRISYLAAIPPARIHLYKVLRRENEVCYAPNQTGKFFFL